MHLLALLLTSALQAQAGSLGHFEYRLSAARDVPALLLESGTWTPSSGSVNLGFAENSLWIRFTIPDSPERLFFYNDYPPMDHAVLFVHEGGMWRASESGDALKASRRSVPGRNVIIPFNVSKEHPEVYVRFQTQSSLQIVPQVFNEAGLHNRLMAEYLLLGGYLGLFVIMMLYHFAVFAVLRDAVFALYSFMLGTTILAQASLNGLLYTLLFPEQPETNGRLVGPLLSLAAFGHFVFARSFLQTRKYSAAADRTLLAAIAVAAIAVILSPFLPYHDSVRIGGLVSGLLAPFFLIPPIIATMRAGNRTARFFLLGWFVFFVGTFTRAAKNFGYLPAGFLTEHGQEIGSAIQVILLSIAVADRINELRREKKRIQGELDKKGRLASIGQVAATVVHDLNGPISVLRGYAEYLRDEHTEEERSAYVLAMENEINYMQSLTRDLLDFSRGELKLDLSPRDVGEFLEHTLAPLRDKAARRGIDLECSVEHKANLRLDYTRMRRVIDNLIGNAIEALGNGGRISVRGESAQGKYRIEIRDNGPGIPESIRTTLFEPFVTAQKAGGTGLGTAIARRIVVEHGGSLSFETSSNQGTVFFIELPAGQAA